MAAALVVLAVDRRGARPGCLGAAAARAAAGRRRLLLVFGLQWLRKAILRASGYKALHDEDKIYAEQLARPRQASRAHRTGLVPDWYGFTLSFKGVLLEGLEVVFIVLTFGSNPHDIGAGRDRRRVRGGHGGGRRARRPGAAGAGPGEHLKFVVGIMLTAFGTFWGAEGAGAHWPGSDAALLVLMPAVARRSRSAWSRVLRSGRARPGGPAASPSAGRPSGGRLTWRRDSGRSAPSGTTS